MHLNERVIIPCYHKNKIVGWIARHVKPNKTDKPKYYVSVQRNYLFNCDQLYTKDRQYAIIVEGPFDAIGIDGIAICGSQISAGQSEYLNSFKKEYILMPDRDRAGKKMIVQAIQNGWSVSFPNWGDNVKDVADAVKKYGRIFTLQSIINNAEKNPVKINIKKRMS